MCGSTRSTISPSSSSTRRSTPCAAGCCGPKLMLNLRTGVSGIAGTVGSSWKKSVDAAGAFVPVMALCLLRLLVARQGVLGAFPRRQEIEGAELGDLHGLVHDALQLVVVADLDIAGHREVFPQRMAVETVVRQDTAQVRV